VARKASWQTVTRHGRVDRGMLANLIEFLASFQLAMIQKRRNLYLSSSAQSQT